MQPLGFYTAWCGGCAFFDVDDFFAYVVFGCGGVGVGVVFEFKVFYVPGGDVLAVVVGDLFDALVFGAVTEGAALAALADVVDHVEAHPANCGAGSIQ